MQNTVGIRALVNIFPDTFNEEPHVVLLFNVVNPETFNVDENVAALINVVALLNVVVPLPYHALF
jgi:hypothetical protein